MNFLKHYWIYIVVAFSVVFLAGVGYLTYTRLNQLSLPEPETPELEPTQELANEVEVEFEISPPVSRAEGLSCIELVATPLEGSVPMTVSFTGLASDSSDTITFAFDFGDETSQSVEADIISESGTVTQLITHTYTKPGSYTASLAVSSVNDEQTSSACTITINAGGLAVSSPTPQISPTLIAQILSPTPIPPTGVSTLPPATPTTLPTASPTRAPSPTNDIEVPQVPQAGSFLPTSLLLVGGIFIVILAFVLI